MKYLVTGATGQFGTGVLDYLLTQVDAKDIAVSVRDTSKTEALVKKGVDARQGDFDKPESLKTAFEGVERLLIVSTDGDTQSRIRQHANAVAAAKEAGVQFIAYTSVVQADVSNLFLAVVHKTTEEAIKATGINYAFLRNNWYLENEAASIGNASKGIPWLTSAGEGKTGWALRADYAEAAAKVLLDENVKNVTYEFGGKPLTQKDLSELTADVLSKDVTFAPVDDSVYREAILGAGFPDFLADLFTLIQKDISKGTLDYFSQDLEKVLGRQLTPLSEGIKRILQG